MLLKDFISNHPIWSMILGPVGGAVLNDFLRIKKAVDLELQDSGTGDINPWSAAWTSWNPRVALWNYFTTLLGSVATWAGVAGLGVVAGSVVGLWIYFR